MQVSTNEQNTTTTTKYDKIRETTTMTNRSQPTKADLAFQSRMEKLSLLHQPPTTNRNQNATTTSICALHSILRITRDG